jgi:membrane protein implicated in regulation of membrane protease activity
LRSRQWKPATGVAQLVGSAAEVTEALETPAGEGLFSGMVRLHGELWRAMAPQTIPAGARVQVQRVTGLTVYVAREGDPATPRA